MWGGAGGALSFAHSPIETHQSPESLQSGLYWNSDSHSYNHSNSSSPSFSRSFSRSFSWSFSRSFSRSNSESRECTEEEDVPLPACNGVCRSGCLLKQSARKGSETALGEFLQGASKKSDVVDYPAMANILISHCMTKDEVIQYTAITWLKEFVQLSGRTMLPFTSGILTAVLPCLAYDELASKDTHEAAKAVNIALMRLVGPEDDEHEKQDEKTTNGVSLEVETVVAVLLRHLAHDSMQTRIATLRWLYHLFVNTPNKMFVQIEVIFPLLLKALSDPSDEVALLDLEVLAEISSSKAGAKYPPRHKEGSSQLEAAVQRALEEAPPHQKLTPYFTRFLVSLINLFSTERQLLEDRGSFIIRQLCLLLNAENIYRCCSEVLLHETDNKFASLMIETLSTILLTSTELFQLRSQLKDLKSKESCALFCCLYKAWCHNPVSTVALCFLTQNYPHASQLLTLFGDLEVTMNFLTEIDKLVQLIESPIFTYLRLQLLDGENNQHLLRSLYGLLMLLPQSDAFHKLQHRLHCVPSVQLMPPELRHQQSSGERDPSQREHVKNIDFDSLLTHFKEIQQKHRADRHSKPNTIHDFDKKFLN